MGVVITRVCYYLTKITQIKQIPHPQESGPYFNDPNYNSPSTHYTTFSRYASSNVKKQNTDGIELDTFNINKHCATAPQKKFSNIYGKSDFNVKSVSSFSTPTRGINLHHFDKLKTLGKGSFGKVLLVRNKLDDNHYAMKVLRKDRLQKARQVRHTQTEREILEKISHPFIAKLQYAFQTEEKLYLITEYMPGGELFFHLKKEQIFSEKKAKFYICEIVLALEHLHKNKIIYRDLKPENILLDERGHIKLTDFGLSKLIDNYGNSTNPSIINNKEQAFTICGTPEYLAPEVLLGNGYNKAVDWWSLGILLFEMLNGRSPFRTRNGRRLDINNYSKPIEFIYKDISEDAKSLILGLLAKDPSKRLGYGDNEAKEIRGHKFFKDINWDKVYQCKLVPDFKPILVNLQDLKYFDRVFTDISVNDSQDSKSYHQTSHKKDLNFQRMKKIRNDFENFSYSKKSFHLGK